MARRGEISLRSFYIFNPNFCEKEGEEHKKILFYHPVDIDLDTKIRDVGLSEAIIKFTGNFTFNDDSCETLHTQKTTQFYYSPEKNYWMIMTINVPYETKTKDESEYFVEYKGDEVHDKIFRSVLQQTYKIFRLFYGTFEMNFIGDLLDEKMANLKKRLELFYSKYLLTLKLTSCDIVDLTRSVQYLPLEKFLFLRVYNFINMIKETFPAIKNCIFLYNEQIVWSEINSTDLYSIYEYLISTLLSKTIQNDSKGGSTIRRSYSLDASSGHYGSFITGPLETFENCIESPKVFIFDSMKSCSCYYLVVYRALNAIICLFVDVDTSITEDFYMELHSFMGPQLSSISTEINDSFTKSNTTQISLKQQQQQLSEIDSLPKYLFINELNFHHIGTIYCDQRRPKNSLIPSCVMNLLADLYKNDDLKLSEVTEATTVSTSLLQKQQSKQSKGKFSEIAIKSINDYWIVKKTSNWRQIYIIINNSKASLLDITNEANKIIEQQTSNIFFEK